MPTPTPKNKKQLTFSITIQRKKNLYINQAAILRSCRAALGWSQKEAAEKLGISASTLCSWEQKGCRDIEQCSQIAKLYGQPLDNFVTSTY